MKFLFLFAFIHISQVVDMLSGAWSLFYFPLFLPHAHLRKRSIDKLQKCKIRSRRNEFLSLSTNDDEMNVETSLSLSWSRVKLNWVLSLNKRFLFPSVTFKKSGNFFSSYQREGREREMKTKFNKLRIMR